MADEFLRFSEGYITAEKVKSDAIHGNFPWFASLFYIFEKNGWKKIRKFRRSSTLNLDRIYLDRIYLYSKYYHAKRCFW